MSEPRLTRVDLDRMRPDSIRRAKFARARLRMTLSQPMVLGISPAQCRWLVARSAVVFNPLIAGAVQRLSAAVTARSRQSIAELRNEPRAAKRNRPCMS